MHCMLFFWKIKVKTDLIIKPWCQLRLKNVVCPVASVIPGPGFTLCEEVPSVLPASAWVPRCRYPKRRT